MLACVATSTNEELLVRCFARLLSLGGFVHRSVQTAHRNGLSDLVAWLRVFGEGAEGFLCCTSDQRCEEDD